MAESNGKKTETKVLPIEQMPARVQTRFKRMTYIIDKEFQYKYLSLWLGITIGFVCIIFVTMYTTMHFINENTANVTIGNALTSILQYNAFFIICIAVFMGLYILLLSHRIAGPAYRLVRCLEQIKAGNLGMKVHLRKKDYLKNIAVAVNELIEYLLEQKNVVYETQRNVDDLKALIEKNPQNADEIKTLLNRISINLGKLAKEQEITITK